MLPACSRISKILNDKFEPYLPIIMDIILTGANQKINFSMIDANDDDVEGEITIDEETGNQCTVVAFGAGNKKKVSINTIALQQKQQVS